MGGPCPPPLFTCRKGEREEEGVERSEWEAGCWVEEKAWGWGLREGVV